MNPATATIVDYLREAHTAEQANVALLEGHLRGAPPGAYRSAARRHLDETRRHVHQVEDRLADLGATDGLLRMGITFAEGVAGRVVGLALGPLNLFVSRTRPEAMLRNAEDAIANEAREIATYEALERLAERAGDTTTASLARSIRADEERALDAFRELVDGLADRVARERLGRAAVPEPSRAEQAARRAGARERPDAPPRPDPRARRPAPAPEAGGDGPRRAARERARTAPVAPVAPGRRRGGQEPTPGQGGGTQNGGPVAPPEPTRGEVARLREAVREREAAAAGAAVETEGAAAPGAELNVRPPWDGYDAMTAPQVVARLRGADEAVKAVVRLYESSKKARKSVLDAT